MPVKNDSIRVHYLLSANQGGDPDKAASYHIMINVIPKNLIEGNYCKTFEQG